MLRVNFRNFHTEMRLEIEKKKCPAKIAKSEIIKDRRYKMTF